MSLFTKDRLYGGTRLDEAVKLGEEYVLWDIGIISEEVPTSLGMASKTELVISPVHDSQNYMRVGTLASAIASKVKEARGDHSDLPAIVQFMRVPSAQEGGQDALVVQFISPWEGDPAPAFTPVQSIDMNEPPL